MQQNDSLADSYPIKLGLLLRIAILQVAMCRARTHQRMSSFFVSRISLSSRPPSGMQRTMLQPFSDLAIAALSTAAPSR